MSRTEYGVCLCCICIPQRAVIDAYKQDSNAKLVRSWGLVVEIGRRWCRATCARPCAGVDSQCFLNLGGALKV